MASPFHSFEQRTKNKLFLRKDHVVSSIYQPRRDQYHRLLPQSQKIIRSHRVRYNFASKRKNPIHPSQNDETTLLLPK
jgi:hypothetical protein